MSKLQAALDLAAKGFHVFPLRENSKLPLISDFPHRATRDTHQIEDWWVCPIMEIEHDYNIGISTSRFGDDKALVVVDVDTKGEKKGLESLELLDVMGKELPATFHQMTPTGGLHLVFVHSEPLKQGVSVIGNGLDIRSKGGYIVGAGSTIEGKPYTSIDLKFSPAPKWLVHELGKAPEKSTVAAPENVNHDAAVSRAIEYLKNFAPESIKGAGGDQTAYKVAAKVKDFGVDQETCLELMMDHWFEGSGWTPEKLSAKIEHAYRYGNDPVGAAAPEAHFAPVEPSEEETHYLEKINKDHALVYVEGGHFIIHETVDHKGCHKRVFMNEATFKRKFSPFTLQKRGTYATEWLDWTKRREYAGVCFSPEQEPKYGYYNLWRGFATTPLQYDKGTVKQRKGLDMFLRHARENVCQGNEALFKWLMGYFAHMVKRPYERPLTTLVFRGSKGVGKNALIDRVGNLLGETHYVVAHDGRYLTSNFNGHLDSCLCLVLDEAIWSGDKSAEGVLKGITTAPTILIERKGKEPYRVDNLVRLVIIGNEDWLVPASTDERRYAVLDVGTGNKQDGSFFHEMRVLLEEEGGNRLLLHYLQTYDLSGVNVNVAPKTAALLDQKMSSLEPFQQWWFDCLTQGQITASDFGDGWENVVEASRFRSAFARYCRERNIRSRLPDERTIGRSFKQILPMAVRTKKWKEGSTAWVYRLPELEDCRKAWEAYIGQEVTWE
jgi:hypothetical protein